MTNHALASIGGTEQWTLTVAKELSLQHDVDVFTFIKGEMADRISEYADIVSNVEDDYDIALCNHNTCSMVVYPLTDCFKVFTSHGPSHKLEYPPNGFDTYVAVSEEVRSIIAMRGINAAVIRNPIDVDLYPEDDGYAHLRVLVMCRNYEASKIAKEAAQKAGYVVNVGHVTACPIDPVEEIPDHDIIITSGRGVYEALTCNKAPYIFDKRSGSLHCDGWVTQERIEELRQFNCSGRSESYRLQNVKQFTRDLQAYDGKAAFTWGRDYVREHHGVQNVVAHYLQLAERKADAKYAEVAA